MKRFIASKAHCRRSPPADQSVLVAWNGYQPNCGPHDQQLTPRDHPRDLRHRQNEDSEMCEQVSTFVSTLLHPTSKVKSFDPKSTLEATSSTGLLAVPTVTSRDPASTITLIATLGSSQSPPKPSNPIQLHGKVHLHFGWQSSCQPGTPCASFFQVYADFVAVDSKASANKLDFCSPTQRVFEEHNPWLAEPDIKIGRPRPQYPITIGQFAAFGRKNCEFVLDGEDRYGSVICDGMGWGCQFERATQICDKDGLVFTQARMCTIDA